MDDARLAAVLVEQGGFVMIMICLRESLINRYVGTEQSNGCSANYS